MIVYPGYRKPNAAAGYRSVTVCHLMNIARWVSELTGETGQRLRWDGRGTASLPKSVPHPKPNAPNRCACRW